MHARMATLQGLLEGVDLPASRDELIRYARLHDSGGLATLLERLPDREYDRIDEVAETLSPVQPHPSHTTPVPREESDLPPGGDDYVKAHPTPGRVRHDAPPENQPQKAIEQASKRQSAQKERQDERLGREGGSD